MIQRPPRELHRTPPDPSVAAPTVLGVDVSHYQGSVNWATAKSRGVRFAWIKASEGSGVRDTRFVQNARNARAAGVLWGPYVFYRFSVSPERHMDALLAQMAAVGSDPSLPIAIDLEDDQAARPDGAAARRFSELVAARWGRAIVYTARWWWARFTTPQAWAGALPLWVADYSGPVDMPRDWTDWTVHQYTSSGDGRYYGAASTAIDLNVYRGTIEQLARLYQPPGMQPPPAPSPIDADSLWDALVAEHNARGVRLSPDSALQTAIAADGRWPVTNEVDVNVGGGRMATACLGQARGTAAVAYVWLDGGVVRVPYPSPN